MNNDEIPEWNELSRERRMGIVKAISEARADERVKTIQTLKAKGMSMDELVLEALKHPQIEKHNQAIRLSTLQAVRERLEKLIQEMPSELSLQTDMQLLTHLGKIDGLKEALASLDEMKP